MSAKKVVPDEKFPPQFDIFAFDKSRYLATIWFLSSIKFQLYLQGSTCQLPGHELRLEATNGWYRVRTIPNQACSFNSSHSNLIEKLYSRHLYLASAYTLGASRCILPYLGDKLSVFPIQTIAIEVFRFDVGKTQKEGTALIPWAPLVVGWCVRGQGGPVCLQYIQIESRASN